MNEETKRYLDNAIKMHMHDGNLTQRVNLFDIFGKIETVSAVPSGTPRDVYSQFKIYSNGATYRFYWYDFTNNAWRYAVGS